ncbi:MAG: methyltransferase domain-containing protein [Oligoflexia bacterium]|nr:methyltransferase domain-containing protein [Oligoflexia bacterium]
MSYVMDVEGEFLRLEEQNKTKNYNIFEDIDFIDPKEGEKILDAGSGSGLLLREIYKRNPHVELHGVDYSEIRIKQSTKYCQERGLPINFSQGELKNLSQFESNSFDKIVCRFVYEYLDDPLKVTQELKRVLKKGGELILIDNDGVLFNIFSQNEILNSLLSILKTNINVDLYVGRKLPYFVYKSGFKDVYWKSIAKDFTDEEKTSEFQNNKRRFDFAKDEIIRSLGSEEIYQKFCELYLSEMEKNETIIFMNKFLVKGKKDV